MHCGKSCSKCRSAPRTASSFGKSMMLLSAYSFFFSVKVTSRANPREIPRALLAQFFISWFMTSHIEIYTSRCSFSRSALLIYTETPRAFAEWQQVRTKFSFKLVREVFDLSENNVRMIIYWFTRNKQTSVKHSKWMRNFSSFNVSFDISHIYTHIIFQCITCFLSK